MNNHYLYITKEGNKIEINSSDNVFSSIGRRENKEGFDAYCDEKAHEWLASKLGNYSAIPMKHRKIIAEKWLAAKNLPEGNYDYYFNLESTEDIFRKEVDSIAKRLRISNYTLIMKQYIDKSALATEIEKRIKETESMQPKFDQFWAGQISAFKGILKILDTLEVKEVAKETRE